MGLDRAVSDQRSAFSQTAVVAVAACLLWGGSPPCIGDDEAPSQNGSAIYSPAILAGKVKSPVSPQESLEHIVVDDGLKVELAACEPQVTEPVAIRFDEHGRIWVVEMGDYPTGEVG